MVENITIKSIKKVITYENKFLKTESEDNEIKRLYNNAQADVNTFFEKGISIFYRKEIIFGEEELVKVKISQSLANITELKLSKTIILFNSEPTHDNFIKLCNAYFFDLLSYISASKSFEESSLLFLESDISLLYIFTMTFFSEKLDKIEPIILKGLDYRKGIRDSSIRGIKGSYGRDSVLYLAYWLAKEYNRDECVVKDLLSYCNDKIDSSFILAVENILSGNEGLVFKYIGEMAEYHIKNSKTSDLTYPFHSNHWIYFPVEILALLQIREANDLDSSFISHPLINIFIPFNKRKIILHDYSERLFDKVLDNTLNEL